MPGRLPEKRLFSVPMGKDAFCDCGKKAETQFVLTMGKVEAKRLAVDAVVDSSLIPPDAKVSCKYGDRCTSPSYRDQTKRDAWMCGSDFSHNDRLTGCVGYNRFENSLKRGQSGNRRFPK